MSTATGAASSVATLDVGGSKIAANILTGEGRLLLDEPVSVDTPAVSGIHAGASGRRPRSSRRWRTPSARRERPPG